MHTYIHVVVGMRTKRLLTFRGRRMGVTHSPRPTRRIVICMISQNQHTYIHTRSVCTYHHVIPYMYVLGPRLQADTPYFNPPQQERVSRPKGDMTSDGDHCFKLRSMYVLVLTHSSQSINCVVCLHRICGERGSRPKRLRQTTTQYDGPGS